MKVHVELIDHPERPDIPFAFTIEVDPSQVIEPGMDTPGVLPVLRAALAAAETL